MNAPGNNVGSGARMNRDARILAQIDLPAHLEAGAVVPFPNEKSVAPDRLLTAIKEDRDGGMVSFVITANSDEGQAAGCSFAAKENGSFDPPGLVLTMKK